MDTTKTTRSLEMNSALDAAQPSTPGTGKPGLIGASVCCLGPLVLVSVGLGGAWVSATRSHEERRLSGERQVGNAI